MNVISFHLNTVKIIKQPFLGGPALRGVVVTLYIMPLVFLMGCGIHEPSPTAGRYDESPSAQIIHFYQGPLNHLSAVRYGDCPMYPSCSHYGLSAIEHHGALIGWMMAFDRLIRCGRDESHLSPEVIVGGDWKYIDTLEQNDFWWCKTQGNKELTDLKPSEHPIGWGISIE